MNKLTNPFDDCHIFPTNDNDIYKNKICGVYLSGQANLWLKETDHRVKANPERNYIEYSLVNDSEESTVLFYKDCGLAIPLPENSELLLDDIMSNPDLFIYDENKLNSVFENKFSNYDLVDIQEEPLLLIHLLVDYQPTLDDPELLKNENIKDLIETEQRYAEAGFCEDEVDWER